jgi:hypothetical protein
MLREQLVDEGADLGERQLGARVRIEHRGVVDVVAAAVEGGAHGQLVHVQVRPDQRMSPIRFFANTVDPAPMNATFGMSGEA